MDYDGDGRDDEIVQTNFDYDGDGIED